MHELCTRAGGTYEITPSGECQCNGGCTPYELVYDCINNYGVMNDDCDCEFDCNEHPCVCGRPIARYNPDGTLKECACSCSACVVGAEYRNPDKNCEIDCDWWGSENCSDGAESFGEGCRCKKDCSKHKCAHGCPAKQDENGDCVCDCNGSGCTHPYSDCAAGKGWYYGGTFCHILIACPGSLTREDQPPTGPDPYPGGWAGEGPYVTV